MNALAETLARIYLSPPHLSGDEMAFLQQALNSNWIAPVGPFVNEFESLLARDNKIDYVVSTNSGTSAIHLALLAVGVKEGDEVICSSLTFCASANPIIYCGASPVFIDSENETWNLDPVLLREALIDRITVTGRKPAAIVLVHLYGMPAKITDIIRVANEFGVPLIEDAAEGLGSTFSNQPIGTFGAAGILSFNGNKIITASSGGALLTNSKALAEQARFLSQEAKEPLPYYQHHQVGYNYRFSNVLAALGCAQLRLLQNRVAKRRKIFDTYKQGLAPIKQIEFLDEPDGYFSNRWLTVIQTTPEDVQRIRLELEKNAIETRQVWKPMHLQPVFQKFKYYGNGVSDTIFARGLCLPSGSSLTDKDQARVIDVIHQLYK